MKYNFIETDNLYKTILEINNISESDLETAYDFDNNDEVFLNFKEKLLALKDKRFLIVGDYDADGICATTIIKRLFNYLNINSNHYIPSRLKDGYGLNIDIVEKAKDNGFGCLIAVDNGIVAYEAINKAKEYGIKVFIIDHHQYDKLPDCEAIIHSNIVSKKYQDLSAGGLSFVLSKLIYEDDLSLVLGGLSTISDMMSVIGFNRYLIREMLKRINSFNSLKLLNDGKLISYRDISFTIVPKINAISRMEPEGNPNYLVKFFNDDDFAKKYIQTINYLNDQRKILTKKMTAIAEDLIDNRDNIILISSEHFKEGLCGLIANRLMHELNKPIIILSKNMNNELKGSGRAPEGLNFYELIKGFSNFIAFGGHESAIGLTISAESLIDFKKYLKGIEIKEECVKDVILLDKECLDEGTLNVIEGLKPFGTNLQEPLLAFKNEGFKKVVVSDRFPKFIINPYLSAISFNEHHKEISPSIFVGHLSRDTYRPRSLSFTIEEMLENGI